MTQAASGTDLSTPEVYDIVWSPIIFVTAAVFFYKFFIPKFNAVFGERVAKIQGSIAKAEQARKGVDEIKAKHRAQSSTARMDVAKIRGDVRTETLHIIVDARFRAESDVAQITASAQHSIESQHQQVIASLKGEVGVPTTALADKILGAKLEDNDVQSSMIDLMIGDLGAKK